MVLAICYCRTCYDTRIRAHANALVAVSDPVPSPRATRLIYLGGATMSTPYRVDNTGHCISMSSCEAELIALADTAIELIHTDAMLQHIGSSRSEPIEVGTDNKGAYDLCHRFTIFALRRSPQNSRHDSC